jgi:hypothetical protein
MKQKFPVELSEMYNAVRLLLKAKAALFVGQEAGFAGRVGGLAREIECEIEKYEVVECRSALHNSLPK